jgi:hypothetical protein
MQGRAKAKQGQGRVNARQDGQCNAGPMQFKGDPMQGRAKASQG